MANVGHFVDRNPDIRVAGISSGLDGPHVDSCLKFGSDEEMAQWLIDAHCKHKVMKKSHLLLKRTPCIHEGNVKQLLTTDLTKSRFMAFKEKFSEAMYFKKAELGKAKPTQSKPDNVTNTSHKFGVSSSPTERLYPLILPPKLPEQVMSEYCKFHDKYILSHNHYFPGEQINRHYTKPFDRNGTFGALYNIDDNGKFVKRCLQHCDQLIIVSRPQMDFIDRTCGPLGRKYKKYPYDVPEDMIHGVKTNTRTCDCKMLIENINPCENNNKLVDAFSHLNKMRRKIHESEEFQIYDLVALLAKHDREKTGYLSPKQIFETMHKLELRVDDDKMRIALSHFGMILDPCCPTERVNYEQFCQLLMVQLPLPKTGNISTMPANIYNKDTTYRLLCEDLKKEPNKSCEKVKLRTIDALDAEVTHVGDLITPNIPTRYGLGPSEFDRLRSKDKMLRIFTDIIGESNFQTIWNEACEKYPEQNERITVNQFRNLIREKDVKIIL